MSVFSILTSISIITSKGTVLEYSENKKEFIITIWGLITDLSSTCWRKRTTQRLNPKSRVNTKPQVMIRFRSSKKLPQTLIKLLIIITLVTSTILPISTGTSNRRSHQSARKKWKWRKRIVSTSISRRKVISH